MSLKKLEICCVSLSDCIEAQEGGSSRIELCSSMAAEGLTPSYGLFQLVKQQCDIPVVVMIRPRGVGFCYNSLDYNVMKQDAHIFLSAGAEGIVFGFLDKYRNVDKKRVKEFIDIAHQYGKEAVFHRAIDQCNNILEEIRELISLGIDRVLTAGGKGNATDHIEVLQQLQSLYKDKIQMCGSIRSNNVLDLMKSTKILQIHSACRTFEQDPSDEKSQTLNYQNAYDKVSIEEVTMINKLMQ